MDCGVEVWRAVMVVVGLTLRLQQQHQPVTVLGAVGGLYTPDTATACTQLLGAGTDCVVGSHVRISGKTSRNTTVRGYNAAFDKDARKGQRR